MVAFRVTPAIASTLPAMARIVILPDIWPVNMATFALAEEAVYSAPGVAGFVPDGAVVLETATPLPPTGFTDTVNARAMPTMGGGSSSVSLIAGNSYDAGIVTPTGFDSFTSTFSSNSSWVS